MQQTIEIDCEAFHKNSDGSWTSVQVTDIKTPTRAIRISPSMNFRKGRAMWGIDVAALLDESYSQRNYLAAMTGIST